jgi:hypothetical protein
LSDKDTTLTVRVKPVGLNNLSDAIKAPAKKTEETLSGAIKTWIVKSGRDVAGFANRTKAAFVALRNVRLNKEGFLSALHTMDVKALVVARKIKNYFKDAFSGAKGRIGVGTIAAGQLAADYGKQAIDAAVGTTVQAASEANRVQEAANRISIGARGAGQEYVDPKALTKEFFDVARDVKGITGEAAADAAAKFVSLTGDLATVRSSLRDFGVAATASGAEIGDVSEAVASVSTQFGVTDPKEVRDVLAALIYQGKAGSFELKDAASLFQRLAASGSAFGIQRNAQGVKTLGGLTQIARSGTGSGEQAATAVESLLTNLKVKSGDLRAAGVKVYDKGKVRDVPDILVDAISKVGGTNTEQKNAKLAEIFGEQGIRAINPLIAKYQATFAQTEGTNAQKRAAAIEMLRQQFNGAINAAGTWTDVMQDSERAQSTNSAKLTAAWQSIVAQVSESVTPALSRLVDEFSNNPDAIRGFTDAIIFAGEMLGSFADFVGMFTSGQTIEEYGKSKAAREARGREAKAGRELASLRMSPEQIAKLEKEDPQKLGNLRAQATLLQIQKESAGDTASRLEQEVLDSQAQHGGGVLGKLAALLESEGPSRAQAARKMGIDGVVQARIVNANDLKQPAGNAPSGGAPTAPGYATRGG